MLTAGMIVLGIGAGVAVLGLIFGLIGRSPYTEQTQGVVVGMCMNAHAYNNGGSGNVNFLVSGGSASTGTRCPVFEYRVGGTVYRRASLVAYNCSYVNKMIGQPRTVYYDPRRPERAALSKKGVLGVLGITFLSIGIGMVALGAAFMVLSKLM